MKPAPISVVRLSGELDVLRRDEIREALHVDAPGAPLLVDLSEVTYADSTTLAELLRFHREAKEHSVNVALVIVSRQFARLVQYAGLAHAFAIFDNVMAARGYLENIA